jgi:hypothetical protein
MALVALLQCDDVADRLERNSVFGAVMEFSEAWRRGTWEGIQPHLALLLLDDEVRWLGRAQAGRAITTRDRIVRVTDIEEIDPIPLSELGHALPSRHRTVVGRIGVLPPGGGAAVVNALRELRPTFTDLISRLQRPLNLQLPHGRAGELLNQERDGLGVLLDLAGIRRQVLRTWSPARLGVPFLAGFPESVALEDDLITHDIERFGSWLSLPSSQVAWRAFTDGRSRIFVMNANRTAVERTLGVDVVYWHAERGSFVLVQYKKMQRQGSEKQDRFKLIYRPDHNLESELERMRRVDAMCSG